MRRRKRNERVHRPAFYGPSRTFCAEALESRMLLAADVAEPVAESDYMPTDESAYVATSGDSNGDGVFDQLDLQQVLRAGKYRTGEPADWSQGDWNGDERFDHHDLVTALRLGRFMGRLGQPQDLSLPAMGPDGKKDDDQRGNDKRDDDDTGVPSVLQAAKLIKKGKTYSLAHILANDSPTNPFVSHSLTLDLQVGPLGTNELVALAETVHSNFMHVGTQFDALGHIGIGDQFYDGTTRDEIFSEDGLLKFGADEVPPFFTRGVLVDIARYKDVAMLPGGYEITLEDLEGALRMQKTKIRSGDVVLFHTGWGANYTANPELFVETQPGIGLDVARSLASREVVMVGADNVFVDVFPNPNPDLVLPVHQEMLTKNGIYLMEIVKTDELARDRVYEFAFAFAPIRAEGATGSAAHPFALV